MSSAYSILGLPTSATPRARALGTAPDGVVGLLDWRTLRAFLLVGAAATALYCLLYLGLRASMDPGWANVISLVVSTLAGTAAHRRLTFEVSDPTTAAPHQVLGLLVLVLGLGVTTGSVQLLHDLHPGADALVELLVQAVANGVAGALRYGIFGAAMRSSRAVR